jgi:hypothetical protein
MRLHVSTTTWSSSGPLNLKKKAELQLQRQLFGQIEVSVFGVTKCMSAEFLKPKQSVLLFAVFIKEASDNKTSSNAGKFYY